MVNFVRGWGTGDAIPGKLFLVIPQTVLTPQTRLNSSTTLRARLIPVNLPFITLSSSGSQVAPHDRQFRPKASGVIRLLESSTTSQRRSATRSLIKMGLQPIK